MAVLSVDGALVPIRRASGDDCLPESRSVGGPGDTNGGCGIKEKRKEAISVRLFISNGYKLGVYICEITSKALAFAALKFI